MNLKYFTKTIPTTKDIKNYVTNLIKGLTPLPGTKNMYFVLIDPAMCCIDADYQSDYRQARISKLTPEIWNPRLLDPIKVNFRLSELLAIFDGAHRAKTALLMNNHAIPAYLYLDMSREEEIDLFLRQDNAPLPIKPIEKWLARRSANDERITYLDAVMARNNFRIKDKNELSDNMYEIAGISHLMAAADKFKSLDDFKKWADFVFNVYGLTNWGIFDNPSGTSKPFIDGLTMVWKKHYIAGTLEIATFRLVSVMLATNPGTLRRVADKHLIAYNDHENRVKQTLIRIADGTLKIEDFTGDDDDLIADKVKEITSGN